MTADAHGVLTMLGRDVDLWQAELLALAQVRAARQRQHGEQRRPRPAAAAPPAGRPRAAPCDRHPPPGSASVVSSAARARSMPPNRLAVRSTSWFDSTQVADAST